MNRKQFIRGIITAGLAALCGPFCGPERWRDRGFTIAPHNGRGGRWITLTRGDEEAVHAAFAEVRSYDTIELPEHLRPIRMKSMAVLRNVSHVHVTMHSNLVQADGASWMGIAVDDPSHLNFRDLTWRY